MIEDAAYWCERLILYADVRDCCRRFMWEIDANPG